jgi:hypothetical protein
MAAGIGQRNASRATKYSTARPQYCRQRQRDGFPKGRRRIAKEIDSRANLRNLET